MNESILKKHISARNDKISEYRVQSGYKNNSFFVCVRFNSLKDVSTIPSRL